MKIYLDNDWLYKKSEGMQRIYERNVSLRLDDMFAEACRLAEVVGKSQHPPIFNSALNAWEWDVDDYEFTHP